VVFRRDLRGIVFFLSTRPRSGRRADCRQSPAATHWSESFALHVVFGAAALVTPTRAGPDERAFAVEVLHALQPAAVFWALARVICAYLDYLRSCKVIITTGDGTVIQAEGMSRSDVERLIEQIRGTIAKKTASEEAVPANCEQDVRSTCPPDSVDAGKDDGQGCSTINCGQRSQHTERCLNGVIPYSEGSLPGRSTRSSPTPKTPSQRGSNSASPGTPGESCGRRPAPSP
jgi:hypothetical protein